MKQTFKMGSLEWHEMKRDLARLKFDRAMDKFDISVANTAYAIQDFHQKEIERLSNENRTATSN